MCNLHWRSITQSWWQFSDVIARHMPLGSLIAISSLLVAIYIPLVIFLIQDKSTNVLKIDKGVIFNCILFANRWLALSLLIQFLTIAFWHVHVSVIPWVSLIYFGSLVFPIIAIIYSYKWIIMFDVPGKDSFRTSRRIKYLQQLPQGQRIDNWDAVWSDDHANEVVGIEQLIVVFFREMKNISSPSEEDVALLEHLRAYPDIIKVGFRDTYSAVLDFTIPWQKSLIIENRLEQRFIFENHQLFDSFMRDAMANEFTATYFFDLVDLLMNNDQSVDFEPLMTRIVRLYFSVLDGLEDPVSMFAVLPNRWLLISDNLLSQNNTPALVLLNGYFSWVRKNGSLVTESFENDKFTEKLTSSLFLKADPMVLGTIISFFSSLWYVNINTEGWNQILRNFIEGFQRIGNFGRPFVEAVRSDEEFQSHFREALDLQTAEIKSLIPLFIPFLPFLSDVDMIRIIIENALSLEYEPESISANKRDSLVAILEFIIVAIDTN